MSAYNTFAQAVEQSFVNSILPLVINYYEENHGIQENENNLFEYLQVSGPKSKSKAKSKESSSSSSSKPHDSENEERVQEIEANNADLAIGKCIYFARNRFCGAEVEGDKLFCNDDRGINHKTLSRNMPKYRQRLEEHNFEIPADKIKGGKSATKTSKQSSDKSTKDTADKVRTVTSGKKFKSKTTSKKSLGKGPSKASKEDSIITPKPNFKYDDDLGVYISKNHKIAATDEGKGYVVTGAYNPVTHEVFAPNSSTIETAKKLGLSVHNEEKDDDLSEDNDILAPDDELEEDEE